MKISAFLNSAHLEQKYVLKGQLSIYDEVNDVEIYCSFAINQAFWKRYRTSFCSVFWRFFCSRIWVRIDSFLRCRHIWRCWEHYNRLVAEYPRDWGHKEYSSFSSPGWCLQAKSRSRAILLTASSNVSKNSAIWFTAYCLLWFLLHIVKMPRPWWLYCTLTISVNSVLARDFTFGKTFFQPEIRKKFFQIMPIVIVT